MVLEKCPYQMSIDKLVGKRFNLLFNDGKYRACRLYQQSPFDNYEFVLEPKKKNGVITIMVAPPDLDRVEVVDYRVIKTPTGSGKNIFFGDEKYKDLESFLTQR